MVAFLLYIDYRSSVLKIKQVVNWLVQKERKHGPGVIDLLCLKSHKFHSPLPK